jgi:subtilisin family serine protease
MSLTGKPNFETSDSAIAARVFLDVQNSELLVLDNDFAAWIPYPAFVWSQDGSGADAFFVLDDSLQAATAATVDNEPLPGDDDPTRNEFLLRDNDTFDFTARSYSQGISAAAVAPPAASLAGDEPIGLRVWDSFSGGLSEFDVIVPRAEAALSQGDAVSAGAKVSTALSGDPTLSLYYIPSDTLFGDQWHLLNTGQSGGQLGIDINVSDVWNDYTGAGVRVGVVDDGIERTHVDLDGNYNANGQYDYSGNDSDPFPGSNDFTGPPLPV